MIEFVLILIPFVFVFLIFFVFSSTAKTCNGVWNPFIPYAVSNVFRQKLEEKMVNDWVVTKVSSFTAKKCFDSWWEIYAEVRKRDNPSVWSNNRFLFNEATFEISGLFNIEKFGIENVFKESNKKVKKE